MQSVSSAWTSETKDTVRKIAENLLVSWKKETNLSQTTFTIGVSTIGGNDIIGITPGAVGGPGIYKYFDESEYIANLAWERSLNMPIGGLSMAMAEATLDNTNKRFTPRFMGGNSELFTAVLTRRPALISAGFNFNGIDQTIPQFSGIFTRQPRVDTRGAEISLQMADYIDFFSNRFLDRTAVFTSVSTDTIMETMLQTELGMSTSQFDLDPGISVIPFAMFNRGEKFSKIFQELASAENGQFYQNEEGIFKFENRQHWDSSPYTEVQRVISTGQVINALEPSVDHVINVVEIKASVRSKAITQAIWSQSIPTLVPANSTVEIFADFLDDNGSLPVLEVFVPTYSANPSITSFFSTNTQEDGSGATNSGAISLKSYYQFTTAYKMVFENNSSQNTYLTQLELWGRPAKVTSKVYTKRQRDSSVTAYEEQPLTIENDFIQSQDWADSFAEQILEDFANPENLQEITIAAIPELQLGDLISWQGRYWRVYSIKSKLDPSTGFIQDLKLLQRTIRSYFRVGISTIGGSDQIAP